MRLGPKKETLDFLGGACTQTPLETMQYVDFSLIALLWPCRVITLANSIHSSMNILLMTSHKTHKCYEQARVYKVTTATEAQHFLTLSVDIPNFWKTLRGL